MTTIEKTWRSAWLSPDRRDICSWAADNIKFSATSPFPGPFNVDNLPWTRRIYEAWQDPLVREVLISGSPQKSGKTVAAQVCMSWQLVNDPTAIGFYADTGAKAKTFKTTRWDDMFKICKALADRVRSNTMTGGTVMRDGSFLLILGAESEANRQSHTFKVIIKDEAWRYGHGWGEQINNRAKAFERTNDFKIMSLGTGGTVGTDFQKNHAAGTCEVYEVPCEYCGEYYHYKWDIRDGGVFRWDEIKDDHGNIDIEATKKTAHIECPHCHGKIFYERAKQFRNVLDGRWRSTNPEADGAVVSLTIPGFVSGQSWPDFVENWLRIGKGRSVGYREALKNLIIFDLAEFWEDRPIVEKSELIRGEYTRAQIMADKVPGEQVRLATVDYQHGMRGDSEHCWYVVRAWGVNGGKLFSKMVDCGRINDVPDLHQHFIRCGVQQVDDRSHILSRVWMDCAFKQNVVFDYCMRFKWCGVRGEDRDSRNNSGNFLHHVQRKKNGPVYKIYKSFSEVKWGEVGVGKTSHFSGHVPWRSINNQTCHDMLYELRSGKSSVLWEVPEDIDDFCPEYAKHINSHARVNVSTDESRPQYKWKLQGNSEQNPDHLYACEKYQIGAALFAELLSDATEKIEE